MAGSLEHSGTMLSKTPAVVLVIVTVGITGIGVHVAVGCTGAGVMVGGAVGIGTFWVAVGCAGSTEIMVVALLLPPGPLTVSVTT